MLNDINIILTYITVLLQIKSDSNSHINLPDVSN